MVGGQLTRHRGCTGLGGRVSHDTLRVSPTAGAAAQSTTRGRRPFCTQRASQLRQTQALGHPPPTMAGTSDKSSPRGTGPRVLVHPRSLPPIHIYSTEASSLFSPFPLGSSEPLLSPPPGEAGCHPGAARRQAARLAVKATSLSTLLERHRHLSWALGPEQGRPSRRARTPRPGLHRRLTGARATGGRQKSWSATRVQGLLSTVLRPSFIHPPFVQVSPHTTLIKYPPESSIPAAAPSELSSRALTVGAQDPD